MDHNCTNYRTEQVCGECHRALLLQIKGALFVLGRFEVQGCPCGARPETPNTHPHVLGCHIEEAIVALEGRATQKPKSATCDEQIGTPPKADRCGLDLPCPDHPDALKRDDAARAAWNDRTFDPKDTEKRVDGGPKEQERDRCLRIAEERTRYSIPGSKDFDLGWKRCAEAIARDIRVGQ